MVKTGEGFAWSVLLSVFLQPRDHVVLYLRGFVHPRVEGDGEAADSGLVCRIPLVDRGHEQVLNKVGLVFGNDVFLFLGHRLDLLGTSKLSVDGHVVGIIGEELTNHTRLGLEVLLFPFRLQEPRFRRRFRLFVHI